MQCEPNRESTVETKLTVNEKEVQLNPFVKEFIAQTTMGMLKALKNVEDIHQVNLSISIRSD